MAPEQLAGTRVTAAADMWSWAVTMVFAGTGELPFKGDSLTATAYAILYAEPQVGGLPEPLGSLVYRCLNKDAAGRPSARDVLAELVAAGARPVGPMPPMVSALAVDEEASGSPCAPVMPPRPRHGSGEGLIAARPASGPRSARHGSHRIRWRRRAPLLLAAGLLAAAVGVLVFILPRHGARSEQLAGSHGPVTTGIPAETAARKQAITWILRQVSRAAVVSCDPQVCADLVSAGFPPGNVWPLGPTSNDPLGSALVVATGPIRAQYGSRLASVYAPATIASFGSGDARIDILLVYPGGAATYDADERTALPDRKTAGAQLLANSNIEASAAARAQLLSGDVDPRLPQLLAIMAGKPPRAHRGLRQPVARWRTCQPAAVSGPGRGGQRGAHDSFRVPRLDASVHCRAASPIPPIRATGHAEYWPNRAEDRVWRAEPAQLAEVRAGGTSSRRGCCRSDQSRRQRPAARPGRPCAPLLMTQACVRPGADAAACSTPIPVYLGRNRKLSPH